LRRIGAEWIDEAGEAIALGFLAAMGAHSETQLLVRRAGQRVDGLTPAL
jgi:hypothetical protein